jgi:predicted N-acetyltransferase YhbS
MRLVEADLALRGRIQDTTFPIWNEGLTRAAFSRWNEAQMRTPWGRDRLHRVALVGSDGAVLASMKRYRFTVRYDGETLPMVGIGALFTPPERRRRGHAEALVERVIEREQAGGAGVATLFSEIGAEYYAKMAFEPVPLDEVTVTVRMRGGAPATLVRTPDVVHYAIAKKRLLASEASKGPGLRARGSGLCQLRGFSRSGLRAATALGPRP